MLFFVFLSFSLVESKCVFTARLVSSFEFHFILSVCFLGGQWIPKHDNRNGEQEQKKSATDTITMAVRPHTWFIPRNRERKTIFKNSTTLKNKRYMIYQKPTEKVNSQLVYCCQLSAVQTAQVYIVCIRVNVKRFVFLAFSFVVFLNSFVKLNSPKKRPQKKCYATWTSSWARSTEPNS